jgi:hypothetical protein
VGRLFAELKIVHLRRIPVPQLNGSAMAEAERLAERLAIGGDNAQMRRRLQQEFDGVLFGGIPLDDCERASIAAKGLLPEE